MDALSKAFKAKGLNGQYPDLYKQINHYKRVLYAKGPLTEEEANAQL